jgi:hypothetical protein
MRDVVSPVRHHCHNRHQRPNGQTRHFSSAGLRCCWGCRPPCGASLGAGQRDDVDVDVHNARGTLLGDFDACHDDVGGDGRRKDALDDDVHRCREAVDDGQRGDALHRDIDPCGDFDDGAVWSGGGRHEIGGDGGSDSDGFCDSICGDCGDGGESGADDDGVGSGICDDSNGDDDGDDDLGRHCDVYGK